jgi:hypothetical protein
LSVGLDVGEAEELELEVLARSGGLDLDIVLFALVLDGDWWLSASKLVDGGNGGIARQML